MKKIFWLFIIGLLLGSCSSDAAIDEEPTVGSIAGSVSDQTTGEPVATVNVTLTPGGKSTVTGSDGSFSFIDLSPDAYTIDIRKEGYKDNSRSVDVNAGKSTEAHLTIERIPATVTADRTELDFGSDYWVISLSFNIVNNHPKNLEWEVVPSSNCGWIKNILPVKGSLAHGQTGTIIVQIDRESLQDGNNKTVLVLTTTGVGSTEITVKAVGVAKKTAALNTLEPISIAASSATVNGEIVDSGYPIYSERGFVYSELQMPTVEQTIQRLTVPVTSVREFSSKVVGLTLGKTYYVRAYAVNPVGIAYSSNQVSFTTVAVAPQVATLDATDADNTTYSATLRGQIISTGDPVYTERGFVYSTEFKAPTINDTKLVVEGSGRGTFEARAKDFSSEETTYVRAYATNHKGTAYGETVELFAPEWIELPAAGIAVQRKDIGYGNWSSINAMCKNSVVADKTDWRLPTTNELMMLYNERNYIGGFTTTENSSYGCYWTSTSHYSNVNFHYCIWFDNGEISYDYSSFYSGRCVRTLK